MTKTGRFVRCVALVLIFGSFVAAEEAAPPPFEFDFKRADDRAETKIEQGQATIAIESPVGISHATVEQTGDAWPESVTLRLNLRGLEHFSAKNGVVAIGASVASTAETPRIRCWKVGTEETQLAANDPFWTEVRPLDGAGKPTEEIPLPAGGCFEIRLPKALFEKNPKSIDLEWIDFYRG